MTDTVAALKSDLANYDGRATTILGEAAAKHGQDSGYLDALIALVGAENATITDGATWLIKAHLDTGGSFSETQTADLLAKTSRIDSWTAALHICQSIGRMTVSSEQARDLANWLDPLLGHDRPFIRAWSLDALCSIAAAHLALADKAKTALSAAGNDSAASVRARARNIART